jgi:hypothetical protein
MGLLKQLTKTVLEAGLGKDDRSPGLRPAGVGTGNIRNSRRPKTGLTARSGEVQIDVPRDRAATFEPQSSAAPSRSPIARFKGGKPKPPRQFPQVTRPDQKDKRMTGRSGERRATSRKPAAAKVEE